MVQKEDILINIIYHVGLFTKNSNILKNLPRDQYINWINKILSNKGFNIPENNYYGVAIDPDLLYHLTDKGELDPTTQPALN